MIVCQLASRIRLITQPDHAHLARRIMERCVSVPDRPRADSILLAIGEHDNGWEEEDASPAVDLETGKVVDFVSAPLAVRHRVWPRAIGRLSHDPWAAALVAQHALTVYDRFCADAAWSAFFAELAALRDAMLGECQGALADLALDYPFVRLGDLISLVFCAGWTEPQQFGEWVVEGAGRVVSVTPSPFAGAVPFEVEARELPGATYRSDADLADAVLMSTKTTLRGQVVLKA
jgi:Protein of unknown function (DUF3891)